MRTAVKMKRASSLPALWLSIGDVEALLRVSGTLFAVALARQGFLGALLLTRFQVEGMPLDFLDDVLLLDLAFETAQSAFQAFSILDVDFCQTRLTYLFYSRIRCGSRNNWACGLHASLEDSTPTNRDIVARMAGIFQNNLLQDKVAFVTGGGSGIGQRMAERFAEHGAKVVLVGRKQEKLDAAAAGIHATGGFATTAALDVRDYAAMEAAVKKTLEDLGEIDILLCGAAGNF